MAKAKIGVLVHTDRIPGVFAPEDVERLKALGDVRWTTSAKPICDDEAIEILKDCQIAIGSWGTPKPNDKILAACPSLRLWVHAAGTVKGHFGPHMKGRGLKIATCKGAIADNVAEMAVAEIIIGLRRIPSNAAANRAGVTGRLPNMKCLCDSTVGVIGASDVGRRAIALLRIMGCREVLVYDPYLSAEQAAAMGATKLDGLIELCRRSDAVTLHAPAIPATARMLAAPHFKAMGDDCVFVNTARGMCVDEAALAAELKAGRLFAFLDVSDPEPAAADSPLRKLPNVVYTSHIAGGPGTNIGRQAVDDVAAFLRGDQPTCIVTEEMLDRLA